MTTVRGNRRYARGWFRLLRCAVPVLDPSEDPHDQVIVNGVGLDTGIVELVEELWWSGYETLSSCQGDSALYRLTGGHPDTMAYVCLPNRPQALALVDRLQRHAKFTHHGQVRYSSRDGAHFVSFDPGLSVEAGVKSTDREVGR